MPVTVECETCGEQFDVDPHREDSARFCSNPCRGEWMSDAFQEDGAPNYSGGKESYECDFCGERFQEWESQMGGHAFCSQSCFYDWQKYYKPINITFNPQGYPQISTSNGKVPLQRLLATLLVDDISELQEKQVHHSDLPVWYGRRHKANIAVTYLDNLEVLKPEEHGRLHREREKKNGSEIGNSVLTESDVRQIRTLYNETDMAYTDLAEKFDTSASNIGNIINQDTWQHVE